MKFTLEVELEDERYCESCPALDGHTREGMYCEVGEFEMRQENIAPKDHPFGIWRTPRPKGCPLRKVEEGK
jgi:hypothetical protein